MNDLARPETNNFRDYLTLTVEHAIMSRISNLLRRTVRTDQILDRLERIEGSLHTDQILERLERIEGSVRSDQILERLERIEGSVRPDQILERLERIERSVRTDQILERLERIERSVIDQIVARSEPIERLVAALADAQARGAAAAQNAEAAAHEARLAMLAVQKARLLERHGCPTIRTEAPVAYDSPDHIVPWGTANDNSKNERFTCKLITLLRADRVSVMDLGCSGGGQIRQFIEQGYFGIGVEGSDYSLRQLRAEWKTIPEMLFTADITKPFRVCNTESGDTFRFGAITLWEVIEHIHERDLAGLMSNIDCHLLQNGLVIMSVSPNEEIIDGVALHQTVEGKDWWLDTFAKLGWKNHDEIVRYFENDLVRWEENAPRSFHLALSRASEEPFLSEKARPIL